MSADPLLIIAKASKAHKAAALKLRDAVAEQLPIGTLLAATFGRARITCRVTGHPCAWWIDPSRLRVENTRTGKTRDLHIGYQGHDVVIIELGEASK